MGQSENAGDKSEEPGTRTESSLTETPLESKNSDSEDKSQPHSTMEQNQGRVPVSMNGDGEALITDISMTEKTLNSSPTGDTAEATPSSINTASHSTSTGSTSSTEAGNAIDSGTKTLEPTFPSSKSAAEATFSNSPTSKSTSVAEVEDDFSDTTFTGSDTRPSAAQSGNEKHHNLNSDSPSTACSSDNDECHSNHSNITDNGNQNISNSHSEDLLVNITDQSAPHVNTTQNDTNGNQTSNSSGSEHKSLPLSSQQKEWSVFLRLSNHIEELETNMTLFSIFLDQISSR